jgi:hypothetical protein
MNPLQELARTVNNPIIIAFHEWAALARDLWRARSWPPVLTLIVAPHGVKRCPARCTLNVASMRHGARSARWDMELQDDQPTNIRFCFRGSRFASPGAR